MQNLRRSGTLRMSGNATAFEGRGEVGGEILIITLIIIIIIISIITQVIIEILVISLVEDYVISCYNHLTRGDYSGSTNFQTAAWRFVDVSEEEI